MDKDYANKILIIGANGYYGKYLCNDDFFRNSYKTSRSKTENRAGSNLILLDIIKDNLTEKIDHLNLDFVINLSTPNPDASWDDHYAHNQSGIKNLIEFCNNKKIVLIHFSSVVVDLELHPKHHPRYRNGKVLSEKNIEESLDMGLILKPHLIVTPDHPHSKILNLMLHFKFLKFFLPNSILNYKLNNPIHHSDVTLALKHIIKNKELFNFNEIEKYSLKGPSQQTIREIFENKKNPRRYSDLENKLNLEFKYIYN